MIDLSKVTTGMYFYIFSWVSMGVNNAVWVAVLYAHGFFDLSWNPNEEGNTMIAMKLIGIWKFLVAFGQIFLQGLFHAEIRFIEDPNNMCPVFLIRKIMQAHTRLPRQESKYNYGLAIQLCNVSLMLLMMGELQILNVLYYEKWSMFFNNKPNYVSILVFGSHIGVIFTCLYVIIYRFYKGLGYFFDVMCFEDMMAKLDSKYKSSSHSKNKRKRSHNIDNNEFEMSQPLSPHTANKLESMWKNNNNKGHLSSSPKMNGQFSCSHELQLVQHVAMAGTVTDGNSSTISLGSSHSPRQNNVTTLKEDEEDIHIDFEEHELEYDLIEKKTSLCKWIGIWISRITGVLLLGVVAVFFLAAFILVFGFIYFRIYILGKLLCMDYLFGLNKTLKIRLKRVSDKFNYVLFVLLFETIYLDVLLKIMLENEPTKWVMTHSAMVFFHTKYLKYTNSCIPDYNLIHDYTTYDVLYDHGRTTYSRLLPRCSDEHISKLPPVDDVVKLFVRENDNKFIPEKKMNLPVLFGFYVRWFTHQFANTNEFRHNYSGQPIGLNLSQLYGSTKGGEENVRSYKNGLLQSIVIDGKEFPPIIGEPEFHFHGRKNSNMKEFKLADLRKVDSRRLSCMGNISQGGFETQESSYLQLAQVNDKIFQSPWNKMPAVHGPDFFCIQLIFWRHHQYIARQLKLAYPAFDDEKIFQITKMCNILTCIQATLGLYGYLGIVQSNVSAHFDYYDFENVYNSILYKLLGPNKVFPTNSNNVWIELNFMYRWHQLIPPKIKINKYQKTGTELENVHVFSNSNDRETTPSSDDNPEEEKKEEKKQEDDKKHDAWEDGEELRLPYRNYVDILTRKNGLESFLMSSLNTRAGKLCLFNTEKFLCETAVRGSIKKSRFYGLESFNNYRARLGFEKYKSFEELTDDKHLQSKLKNIYHDIDNVEFYVGMFAEEKIGGALHGPFLTGTFAPMIISLITSSRLLRKDWNTILTPVGKQIINKYRQMDDLISLHTDMDKNDIDWKVRE